MCCCNTPFFKLWTLHEIIKQDLDCNITTLKPLLWCEKGIRVLMSYYLFTKFHTSKHLGKRVTQTCMFTLFFVVVQLFTNKLSECWCCINLFTKFYTSKHLGKKVTQHACSHCFVVVRKGYVYQQSIGVILPVYQVSYIQAFR